MDICFQWGWDARFQVRWRNFQTSAGIGREVFYLQLVCAISPVCELLKTNLWCLAKVAGESLLATTKVTFRLAAEKQIFEQSPAPNRNPLPTP